MIAVTNGGKHHPSLPGCSILLVEDEALVAMLLEELLNEMGCHAVQIASRVETALSSIAAKTFDIAILDVNLKGETSYPIADLLELHKIPFVFATGYGIQVVPEKYRWHTVLQKPFRKPELEEALLAALQQTT